MQTSARPPLNHSGNAAIVTVNETTVDNYTGIGSGCRGERRPAALESGLRGAGRHGRWGADTSVDATRLAPDVDDLGGRLGERMVHDEGIVVCKCAVHYFFFQVE